MKVSVDAAQHRVRPVSRARGLPWRKIVFWTVLAAYVVLTLGVLIRSPMLTLDRDVIRLALKRRFPDFRSFFDTYVILGQRGPATLVALPWFFWRAWKSRSTHPLIMLGTALLVLNLSVGIVKVATGRLGPRETHLVHAVFDGGDIYPSGHVSNAVVLYGLIAMLAVSYRRTVAVIAVFLAFSVGLSTIYLDTHWLSDVIGGWLAGGLVLIVLPWLVPRAERLVSAVGRRLRRTEAVRAVAAVSVPALVHIPVDRMRGEPVLSGAAASRHTPTDDHPA